MTKSIACSVVVALAAGSIARADFIVSGYGYAGPVDDVYEFYALDDGTNGTGTRAASVDVTLENFDAEHTGLLGHGFVIQGAFPFVNEFADLTGLARYLENESNPSVLFRGHSDRTFINLLGDESTANPAQFNVTLTNPRNDALNYILTVYNLEVAGNVPGGVDASADANDGRGALIAVGVVQHGDPVAVGGSVTGMSGEPSRFAVQNPEPNSAVLIGIAIGSVLSRRHRMLN